MAKSQTTKNTQQEQIFSVVRSIDTNKEVIHNNKGGDGGRSDSLATYLPSEFNLQEQNTFPMRKSVVTIY